MKLGCSVKVQLLGERNLTKGYKNRLWWANAQVRGAEQEAGGAGWGRGVDGAGRGGGAGWGRAGRGGCIHLVLAREGTRICCCCLVPVR